MGGEERQKTHLRLPSVQQIRLFPDQKPAFWMRVHQSTTRPPLCSIFSTYCISASLSLLADILQHCDDIDSAFCRVLYHPDLAIVFAYIFGSFLLTPVGQVLGSCSASSHFSLLSNLLAFVATCANLVTSYPLHPLAAAPELQASTRVSSQTTSGQPSSGNHRLPEYCSVRARSRVSQQLLLH
jgi:hypothetical protein